MGLAPAFCRTASASPASSGPQSTQTPKGRQILRARWPLRNSAGVHVGSARAHKDTRTRAPAHRSPGESPRGGLTQRGLVCAAVRIKNALATGPAVAPRHPPELDGTPAGDSDSAEAAERGMLRGEAQTGCYSLTLSVARQAFAKSRARAIEGSYGTGGRKGKAPPAGARVLAARSNFVRVAVLR